MTSKMDSPQEPSFLHRVNPLVNFLGLVIMTTSVFIYPSWVLSSLLLVLVFVGFKSSRVEVGLNSGRVRFLILFSLFMLIVQILVSPNGTVFFYLLPEIGTFGPLVPVTDFGIERGLGLSVRFLLIVFSSMLFVSVTDPTLLAHSLTRMKIPYRYGWSLVIALRFIPLFDAETNTVRMAQRSRGLAVEVKGLKKILRTIRYTFFPLLVSALSKVETLSLSMDGRGFGFDDERTYVRKSEWRSIDSLLLVIMITLLVLSVLLAVGLINLPFMSFF